jgi:hypothetical protein
MSVFITETTAEKPRVLMVSQKQLLQERLARFFIAKGLDVVVKTPAQILSHVANREPFSADQFYKILWIYEPSESLSADWSRLLAFFQQQEANLVVITHLMTQLVLPGRELPELREQLDFQERVFAQVRKKIPWALYLVGQDVLGKSDEILQVFSYVFASAQNGVVSWPSSSFHFQDENAFFESIEKYLLSPLRGSVILFQGKKRKAEEYVDFIGRLGWRVNMVDAEEVADETLSKVVKTRADVDGLVREILKKLAENEPVAARLVVGPPQAAEAIVPQAEMAKRETILRQELTQEIALVSSAIFDASKFVVPVVIPYIENRLKNYEKKMEELWKRNQFTQYWKSSLYQRHKHQSHQVRHANFAQSKQKKNPALHENDIEKELVKIFGEQRVQRKVGRVQKKVKNEIQVKKKQQKRNYFLLFLGSGIGVFFGAAILWGMFVLSRREVLQNLLHLAQAGSAEDTAGQETRTNLQRWQQLLSFQAESYRAILGKSAFSESAALAALAQESIDIYQLHAEANALTEQSFFDVTGQQSGDIPNTFLNLSQKNEELYKKLSLFQTQLKSLDTEVFSEADKKTIDDYLSTLQDQRKNFAIQEQLQQAWSGMLGFTGRKTFLVLLQNNQELRPTGGFLQSVALLTFDKGSLVDSQAFDVNEVDHQFGGQIAPPAEVQAYLGDHQWFLRDMNWDPNFPNTAQQTANFVEKALGKKIDGVIALNLFTLQDILKATGPVSLPEYNEVVSEKNLFDRAEFHSEVKLVQSAKTEYFSALLTKVLAQTAALPKENISPFLKAVYENLRSNQAFVYFRDGGENSLMENLGWGGDIRSPQCPSPLSDVPCAVDTMFQVEANVGVNKANRYLDRSITHTISISPTEVKHERVVVLKNNATSNSWPMGSYKAYIRFYVPDTAQLDNIKVNGAVVLPNQEVVREESGKKYFGVFVEVPIQQTSTLTLDYSEPLGMTTPFSYVFFEQKQSGTGSDPLTIQFTPDPSLHPAVVAPQAEVTSTMIRFTNPRDKNAFVGVKFN